jgi:RNA polymerase sigma factor for flagellar operon FliA
MRTMDSTPAITSAAIAEDLESETVLWQRHRAGTNETSRQALIERYVPYARIVAASYYARRFDDEIEFADYFQLASIAVVECIDRFDPALGVQFKTFAARRMHGSILSGIERITEKQQQIAAVRRLKAQRLRAAKSDAMASLAEGSDATGPDLLSFLAEVGIGLALGVLLEGTAMLDCDAMGQATDPDVLYQQVELRQLRQRISALVKRLSDQQRTVLHDHYFLDTSFEAIARKMKLSNGRISQIHRQALDNLRRQLRDRPSLSMNL